MQTPSLSDQLRFLEIDQETKDILQSESALLFDIVPGILVEFYTHMARWDHLTTMFRDESRMASARKAQQEHWKRLFSCEFDEDYQASVRRIGLIHSKIGLEPFWYIGGYAFTLTRLSTHIITHYKSRFAAHTARKKAAVLMSAVNKCVMLDMGLAISIYLEENAKSYELRMDALAANFETMVGSIVDNVTMASQGMESDSGSLAAMATQASSGADNVAASSRDSSETIRAVFGLAEEMTRSITDVSAMANRSHQSSETAAQKTALSVSTMLELQETIQKVSSVADLISDIAEKTNLLALNATIEAARAGDAGKGFAVVASEVKTLANQTAQATEDIKTQVTGIIEQSRQAADALELVKDVIEDGKGISHDTATAVSAQADAVGQIVTRMQQIVDAQDEVNLNIGHISEGSRGVSEAAESVLGASRTLSAESEKLRESVSSFLKDIRQRS